MEPMKQSPTHSAMNSTSGDRDVTRNTERRAAVSEATQVKVMGRADGSRTTAGGEEPNTNLSSRPDQSLGAMGNAAGLPPSHVSGIDEGMNSAAGDTMGVAVMNEIAELIRQYPLPSMLIGMGIGYL